MYNYCCNTSSIVFKDSPLKPEKNNNISSNQKVVQSQNSQIPESKEEIKKEHKKKLILKFY
jgi:hypothetical protein